MKAGSFLAALIYACIPMAYGQTTGAPPIPRAGAAEQIHKAAIEWFDKAIGRVDQM